MRLLGPNSILPAKYHVTTTRRPRQSGGKANGILPVHRTKKENRHAVRRGGMSGQLDCPNKGQRERWINGGYVSLNKQSPPC